MDESDEAAFVRLRLWGIVPDGADEGGLITSGQLEDEETKAEEDAGELASGEAEQLNPHGRRRTHTNAVKARVLAEIERGVSVAEAAKNNGLKSRTAVYGWKKLKTETPDACASKKRSKVCLGGQGRPCAFINVDQLIQWVK
ncbi:hypothetical protein PC114_g2599 [Phytophthora cactorum]|nr:hypothetical protein PC114_g2599 [Phytophthora cactorum]KAG3190491.1 hypothetical protein C6341_g1748 [Phytophthora cactorum]